MPEVHGTFEVRPLGRLVSHGHLALGMEPGGGSGSGRPLAAPEACASPPGSGLPPPSWERGFDGGVQATATTRVPVIRLAPAVSAHGLRWTEASPHG